MKAITTSPILRVAGVLLLACAAPSAIGAAETPPTATAPGVHDGQHDFDFMYGRWKIQVRRLRNPLRGSHDWYEMNGTTVCRPVWNGRANIEEFEADGPDGHMEAMMVRLYDATSRQWSLNWVNQKNAKFDAPTIGEFKDGRGEFYDSDRFEGRRILVRYVWSDMTASSGHFEQSYSADGGRTWEANWVAQSTRVE